ncbi:MAG TPA: hypothetical protein PLE43_02300 [Alphaproteobacteria bacterium]|nr:hypothetical protein [Alphaproteobacteria bacterium]
MGLSLTMTWEEYAGLSLPEKSELLDMHRARLGEDTVPQWKSWAVYFGDRIVPVLSGDDFDSMPHDDNLKRLGENRNLPVFSYSVVSSMDSF